MKNIRFIILLSFTLLSTTISLFAQIVNNYTSATTWTVPANVNLISVRIWGASGGTGGQDCGVGCTNAAASNVGYIVATFAVTAGNVIGIYPGAAGVNGSNGVTNSGGGAGGVASYSTAYNGGRGGNTGPTGSSGGGGGGGAASVLTIASAIRLVAAGAGGGGGMANVANSGRVGSNTNTPNGTLNVGTNGANSTGDGGGGGGGGGGHYGGTGGSVYATGGETAGNGGTIGGNRVVSATSTVTNGTTARVGTGGQIEITYTITVPVTWLNFTASRQTNGAVLLKWSTAAEWGAKDYIIQRSENGINWDNLGTVNAVGNTQQVSHYQFEDQAANNTNYHYRLEQRDLDDKMSYSKIATVRADADRLLSISPNPVINGRATLQLKKAAEVTIYSSTGALLLKRKYNAGNNTLDLSAFSAGTYFLSTGHERLLFIIK